MLRYGDCWELSSRVFGLCDHLSACVQSDAFKVRFTVVTVVVTAGSRYRAYLLSATRADALVAWLVAWGSRERHSISNLTVCLPRCSWGGCSVSIHQFPIAVVGL